jgi:hypothetical protein
MSIIRGEENITNIKQRGYKVGISIRGVRIKNLTMNRDDNGKENITGDYELISSNDKVLAKNGFNGYSELVVPFSSDTLKAYNSFINGVKADVSGVLGLTEEV